jgi:hypothetical protein
MTSKLDSDEIMYASLRESRMVVERLCQSIGVHDGLLRSVTDCGVYSAALGLAGFSGLERQLDLLRNNVAEAASLGEDGDPILFDAAGQHAWFVAEAALDLAVAAHRLTGSGAVAIANAKEPGELGVLRALAEKHGLQAEVAMEPGGRVVARLSDRRAAAPTVLGAIAREGIPVPRALWFHLFHRSHDALAPDTVVSRTHTGSIIVKPDGTIIGKEDPEFVDTDLSMLTKETIVEPAFVRDRSDAPKRAQGGG